MDTTDAALGRLGMIANAELVNFQDFSPTWGLVVTWNSVGYYSNETDKVNLSCFDNDTRTNL